jgi:hypothetical protein
MTKPAYFGLAVAALALPAVLAFAPVKPRYVFPSECFSVEKTTRTTLEAPVKDEKPDMSQSLLRHVAITYKPGCGRLELGR